MFKIYNTATKSKQLFKPAKGKEVKMYVCGPTVYDYAHLGHAKTGVAYDVLYRFLKYLGYKTTYVQNITDVGHLTDDADQGEDKIEKKAKSEKKKPLDIARFYEKEHFKDMKALNVLKPDRSPRASSFIKEIIQFTQTLIKKDYAYEKNGSVYFEVAKFKNYGKLSRRNKEEMLSGARVEIHPDKKNPLDFALWKKADPNHILKWKSPWSLGYPGWHIECSVMNNVYFGPTTDIHGGAIELSFPHHENEIAQSEAATGKRFVRYWVHGGMIMINGEKMSKSKGNFTTIKTLLEKYDPMAIRLFLIQTHYRSPIDFSDTNLQAANNAYNSLKEFVINLKDNKTPGTINKPVKTLIKKTVKEFFGALADDLNTPKAMAQIFNLANEANRLKLSGREAFLIYGLLLEFDMVLGLNLEKAKREKIPAEIAGLAAAREEARKNQDWKKADSLREQMVAKGFGVEDTPNGTKIVKL